MKNQVLHNVREAVAALDDHHPSCHTFGPVPKTAGACTDRGLEDALAFLKPEVDWDYTLDGAFAAVVVVVAAVVVAEGP